MRCFRQPGANLFWRRAGWHARWVLPLAALAAACAQTSQVISLNGTWDFALAADAAAADRLAGFYQDGFQGGGFRPITVPSNWALLGFVTLQWQAKPPAPPPPPPYLGNIACRSAIAGRRPYSHSSNASACWMDCAP